MTDEDRAFLDRITGYANDVCADIDPQKTQVSVQLERLMPVLKEISEETKKPVEDIFIRYMDLASAAMVESEEKLQESLKDIPGEFVRDFSTY